MDRYGTSFRRYIHGQKRLSASQMNQAQDALQRANQGTKPPEQVRKPRAASKGGTGTGALAVRAAILATNTLTGLQTVDNLTLAAGDLVLYVYGTPQDGIYTAAAGPWTRKYKFSSTATSGKLLDPGQLIIVTDSYAAGSLWFVFTDGLTTSAGLA